MRWHLCHNYTWVSAKRSISLKKFVTSCFLSECGMIKSDARWWWVSALSQFYVFIMIIRLTSLEQRHDKTNKDSDQPGHPPSLIRVFSVCIKKHWVLSYPLSAQQRLWSDWADAQADLSLRWVHTHFVGFVMSRFISFFQAVQAVNISHDAVHSQMDVKFRSLICCGLKWVFSDEP